MLEQQKQPEVGPIG